jgi:hypothetical protein
MDDLDELNKKVLLLAILKRDDDEGLNDILIKLEDTRVFSLKDGKKYLKELKERGFIINGVLSFAGEMMAKQVEQEFKL